MNNQEILDFFGKIVVSKFDRHASLVKSDLNDLIQTERFENLFSNMTQIQKIELENLAFEILTGLIFDILKIFEEYPEFELIFKENDKQVNLLDISEMLKAELIIDGGWIERFSKYSR